MALGLALLPEPLRRLPWARKRDAATLFLAANALLDVAWIAAACLFDDPSRLPGYGALNGTPIERAVLRGLSLERAELRATPRYDPVVQAYRRRYWYSVEVLPRIDASPCLSGSIRPRNGEVAVRHRGQWRELCF